MRRFEFIRGNQAKFFEIELDHDMVITRTGRMGTAGKTVEKILPDDMAAEVEFDRLIHEKRRKGFAEVDQASEPPEDFAERALDLVPLDGSAPAHFTGPAMKYMLRRFVDLEIMERHRDAPDLERWTYRVTRQLRLDEAPQPGDASYAEWLERWREVSKRDRAAPMVDHKVGAFKYRVGSHWIVTADESRFLATECAGRIPKRVKVKAAQEAWVASWVAFHKNVGEQGYEVRPA